MNSSSGDHIGRNARSWPAPELLGPSQNVPRGSTIAKPDSQVRTLYLIEKGVAGRFVPRKRQEILDDIRTTGWLLGVIPVLTNNRWGRIVAVTDIVLRSLSLESFKKARIRSEVSDWLVDALARDVSRQQRRASALAAGSTRALIEMLFCELLAFNGRLLADGGIKLTFEFKKTQIKSCVGATREHTSRVVSMLQEDEVLVQSKGWFTAPATSPLIKRIREYES